MSMVSIKREQCESRRRVDESLNGEIGSVGLTMMKILLIRLLYRSQ